MIARKDQTPEEREMFAERRRARDREKSKRRKTAARAVKIAAAPIIVGNKTDPVNRRKLYGRAPEMTKAEMRRDLSQAVLNTARM